MDVQQFIDCLDELKEELKGKKVCVVASNGEVVPAEVRFKLKDKYDVFNLSSENVECVLITW